MLVTKILFSSRALYLSNRNKTQKITNKINNVRIYQDEPINILLHCDMRIFHTPFFLGGGVEFMQVIYFETLLYFAPVKKEFTLSEELL
jgi:hypothetical protein